MSHRREDLEEQLERLGRLLKDDFREVEEEMEEIERLIKQANVLIGKEERHSVSSKSVGLHIQILF